MRKEVAVVVGGAEEEAVVYMALHSRQAELLLQGFQRRRLRHTVGHVEIGGDTAGSSSTALAVDIGLLRQTRLTEVDMVVDDAWQHETSRCVYHLIDRHIGLCGSLCY